MEKQEEERTSLPVERNTWFVGWTIPPTRVGSADAGGVRLSSRGIVDGSRSSGTTLCGPLVLPEWLERSSADQSEDLKFWVYCWSSEVGEEVCCSSGQMEASGGLLEDG